MAAHGNHALATKRPIPYRRLRKMYATDEECARCARFWRGGAASVAFEALAARGDVQRLGIVDPARILASPPRLLGSHELARSVTDELNGGGNFVFVVRQAAADDVYLVTQAEAPRLLLEDADVVTFVENDPASAALKALWLEWNQREQWLAEAAWDGFACSARASREQRMIEVASRVFAQVVVSDETRRAWHGLVQARRPAPVLAYDFRFLATCEPLTLVTDRDRARAGLARALDAALALAQKSGLTGWAGTFAEARRALDAPVAGYCAQLFDGALAPEAVCLFDAAWKGDVFGGMGSWNDVEPTDGYAEVSSALSAALKDAFEAAINAP